MGGKVQETQVAIIGGGIAGTAIARELSKYKVDTCLLEKEPCVGWGITKGSMSLVHGGIAYLSSRIIKRMESDLSLEAFLNQPLNQKERLGETGRAIFFELAPLLNVTITRPGRIMVAADQEQLEIYKVIKKVAEANGVEDLLLLDRDGLREKEPCINPKFVGGIYDPSEAAIFPPEWVTAFAENAKENGVHILLNTEVQAIEEGKGYYSLRTNNVLVKAEFVVNAAGLFADEIAGMIGKPDFSMVFFKCQMLILENNGYIHHVVARLSEPGRPRMLIPTTHGDLLVAHTMEPSTDKCDLSTTKEGLALISGYAPDLIPIISPKKDMKTAFTGFLAFNSKKLPDYLIEFPKERFLTVAIAAPGLGPAPALAQEVVKMLGGEGLGLAEKSDFSPCRLQEPRFVELPDEEKAKKIREDRRHGHIACRCEMVTEGEIVEAIKRGTNTLDGLKFRTRAGMGECQGNFCSPKIAGILARELNRPIEDITSKGGSSNYVFTRAKNLKKRQRISK